MRKNFWSFFISMPATVLIYMPLILLWLEYRQWPLAGFSWWRYGAAFVLLWGGVIFVGLFFLDERGRGRG